MNKAELRKIARERRQQLPTEAVRAKSRVIAEKLLSLVDWPAIKRLHIYRPVPAWKEADTGPIIRVIRTKYPRIKVTIASNDKATPPPPGKFDLIIVPVLGFDKDNYRLGLGGGWYDRFLAAQPQALKIGLAFRDSFVAEGLPREPHDIPLDTIITEV